MIAFNELKEKLPSEMQRLNKMSGTLSGHHNLIQAFQNQFKRPYQHGDNVVYELARVNIIRNSKGLANLI